MATATSRTSVLSLPPELVCQVAGNLSTSSDLKSLRSACSQLSFALEPFLFSHITLDAKQTRVVEDLALNRTRAGRYVRSLDIGSLELGGQDITKDGEAVLAFSQYWASALRSLTSLTSVNWTVTEQDSSWALEQVICNLSPLSTICNIRLYLRGVWTNPVIHPLRQICHFRSLESCSLRVDDNRLLLPIAEGLFDVNCAHLKRLELDGGFDAWTDSERCLTCDTDLSLLFESGVAPQLDVLRLSQFSLRHSSHILAQLGSLKALHLDRCIPYDIWPVLSAANIQLQEVTVDYVDRHLLDYLESYCGLERIRISFNGIQLGSSHSDSVAGRFWMKCLPRHDRTLKSIVIIPKSTGTWCLDSENLAVLRKCVRIEEMTVGINVDDVKVPGLHHDGEVGTEEGDVILQLLELVNCYRDLGTLTVVLKGQRLPWDPEACRIGMERFWVAITHHPEYATRFYNLQAVTRMKL
ncbi:hypothetical protein V5O48_004177 [Marasmius crinis-equi]|uniref:F-box domain-containing protein n=1 Tax=Marasmius crinis-equi TaxID=585013 RepID=A0ABR3FQU6_9AGAR